MITTQQINDIISKIVNAYHPEKVILYGSYAMGNFSEASDLDMVVIKDTDCNFFERIRKVRKVLQPQMIPMDILVFTPEEFNEKKNQINHIAYIVNKEGKTVYERKHVELA